MAAHKRAQVEVVEVGLDRVLWANWSPASSPEVRSLSSMVLHNVRGRGLHSSTFQLNLSRF